MEIQMKVKVDIYVIKCSIHRSFLVFVCYYRPISYLIWISI